MSTKNSLLALAVSLLTPAISAATTEPDVLDRPAVLSSHPAKYVMLASTAAGSRIITVGEHGIIVYSDDRGSSWVQAKVPVSVTLTSVFTGHGDRAWAVGHGGVILESNDTGATWSKRLDGRGIARLFSNPELVEKYENDRGVHDQLSLIASGGPDKPLLDVLFVSAKHGFAVGAFGMAVETTDGGRTWQPISQRIMDLKGRHLYGMAAKGDSIYIAGEQGALFVSADEGRSFVQVATPYSGTYFGVLPLHGSELIVYGLRGHAYKRADNSNRWEKVAMDTPNGVTSIALLEDGVLVAVDDSGKVLVSKNGGGSFSEALGVDGFPFTKIIQISSAELMATGSRGPRRYSISDLLGNGGK